MASERGLKRGSRDKREGWGSGELLELAGELLGQWSKRSLAQEDLGKGWAWNSGASDWSQPSGSPLCLVCLGSQLETAGLGERVRPPACPWLTPWP